MKSAHPGQRETTSSSRFNNNLGATIQSLNFVSASGTPAEWSLEEALLDDLAIGMTT